ncbi:MAG: hypothetical protein M3Z31_09885 [Pseudomonadota bacterium]|nr:hypothetical protein [Pseudomonadota bacterium]
MMLVQMLLPLYGNDGNPLEQQHFDRVRHELTEKFGGLTAYTRAPAEGRWKESGQRIHDEIVIFEVMAERLAKAWWRDYRQALETRFAQQVIVVRAQRVQLL